MSNLEDLVTRVEKDGSAAPDVVRILADRIRYLHYVAVMGWAEVQYIAEQCGAEATARAATKYIDALGKEP